MAELQERMSSLEFAEWRAYAQIEPFSQARADLRSAIVAWLLAEINRDPKKRHRPFTVEEFMPKFGEEPEVEPEPDALWQQLKAWAIAAGGKRGDPE